MSEGICPCGCGQALASYNGQRTLVCHATWRKVPSGLRTALMNATSRTRPGAARAVLRWVLEQAKAAGVQSRYRFKATMENGGTMSGHVDAATLQSAHVRAAAAVENSTGQVPRQLTVVEIGEAVCA